MKRFGKNEPIGVLLVEDNPVDAMVLEALLKKAAGSVFNVTRAASLMEATEAVLTGDVDIVLLDLGLPESTGFDTVKEFVEVSPHPIVVLTSDGDAELPSSVFDLGVQDFVLKGAVRSQTIEHIIKSSLRRYRAEQKRKATITDLIDANLDQARTAAEMERLNKTLAEEIVSRERVQRAFEANEARFRSIFEESPVPLWEMDLSKVKLALDDLVKRKGDLDQHFRLHGGELVRLVGMIETVDISNATLNLFNTESKTQLTEKFSTTLTPQAFKQMAACFTELAKGSTHFETETIFASLDDKEVEVLMKWSVVQGHEKDLSRVLLSTVNITKIKQSERQRKLLSTAIEQSVETVIVTDEKGAIQYANSAFERTSGVQRIEAIASKMSFLKTNTDNAHPHTEIWKTIKKGKVWSGRLHTSNKSGVPMEEEATISPIVDADGKITNFVAVKRDVTREAGLERQLRQSQKLESIGQLAAGIAHEINTPIQYVGDNVRFLQEAFEAYSNLVKKVADAKVTIREAKDLEKVNELCENLDGEFEEADLEFYEEEVPLAISQSLDGGSRISKIVSAMKEFAHPGTEQKTSHNISEAINSTITVARNEWKYVADVETDFDESLPMVPCYLGELNQVLLNMIVNATHAIEARTDRNGEKGTISIGTKHVGDKVEIIIKDSGMGIPEELRERIFDPFFTTKGVGKGSGQGLAIAYSTIVDKHGGEILLDSEIGVGTTFTIRLPLLDDNEGGAVA